MTDKAEGDGAPLRSVACDTRPIMRTGLAHILDELGEVAVTDLEMAHATVAASKPDVFVAGLRIDDPETFRTIAALTTADPELKVLVVADGATVIDLREAVIAGVHSFLLASAPGGEVRDAARSTAAGDRVISPSIAMQLAGAWRAPNRDNHSSALTPRELEVLQLLAEGMTNERIGQRVGMSARTVKTHVQNLLTKLDAADRTGAVARGFRLGLIK